jgi:hypothetical protein
MKRESNFHLTPVFQKIPYSTEMSPQSMNKKRTSHNRYASEGDPSNRIFHLTQTTMANKRRLRRRAECGVHVHDKKLGVHNLFLKLIPISFRQTHSVHKIVITEDLKTGPHRLFRQRSYLILASSIFLRQDGPQQVSIF